MRSVIEITELSWQISFKPKISPQEGGVQNKTDTVDISYWISCKLCQ